MMSFGPEDAFCVSGYINDAMYRISDGGPQ